MQRRFRAGRIRAAIISLLSLVALVSPVAAAPAAAAATTVTFNYTGAAQQWTVPAGVTQITVQAWGAQGGQNSFGDAGGYGGYTKTDLAVAAGETLYVYVGGQPQSQGGNSTMPGGWNGGGDGPYSSYGGGWGGAAGGGGTDIRRGGTALPNRVVVAGGGGGTGGRGAGGVVGLGGNGGGMTGSAGSGWDSDGGTGGTQSAGGTGGAGDDGYSAGQNGFLGEGGDGGIGYQGSGGGGGGGYYGGGGGGGDFQNSGGGGGGGSGYSAGSNTTMTNGARGGHGMLQITVNSEPTIQSSRPATATSWTHVNVQQFGLTATDPDGDSYTGEFVVTPAGGGTARTLTTGLTASGQEASVTADPELAPGDYTWQARACDTLNLCSDYTAARSLTVLANAGPVISAATPPDGTEWTHQSAQTFTLTADDPEADTYHGVFTVTASSGGASLTLTTPTGLSGQTVSVTADPALPAGEYSWQAQACDSLGACGAATAARTLTVHANRAPAASQVSPEDAGNWGYNATQTFTVLATDADGDAYTADIEVTPSGGGASTTLTTASTTSGQEASATMSPALAPGSYTWRVRGCDALGLCGAFTGSRTFTVSPNAAPAVSLVSPADGTKLTTGVAHQFTVSASDPDLDAYHGEIVITPAGGGTGRTLTTGLTVSGQNASATASPALTPGGYTWKARACDSGGVCSGYTATRTLTINDPPAVPSVIQPGPGATFDHGQAQEFLLRAVDPEGDSYSVEIDVQNALGATQRTLTTGAAASGTQVGVVAAPALPAGAYQWRARGCDEASGTCGTYSSLFALTVEAEPVCPTVLVDGWMGDLYARLRTSGPAGGAMTVCFGAATPGGLLQAGRVEIDGVGLDDPLTQGDADACGAIGSPGTDTLLDVTDPGAGPGDESHVRALLRREESGTSVCVSVMSSGQQVVDYGATVANPDPSQLPDVRHVAEVGPAPAERKPLRLDRFSASCHTATGGTLTRVLNANIAGQWVSLHAHQSPDATNLCVRAEGMNTSGGSLLVTHEGQPQNPMTITPGQGPGDPGEPCAENGPTVTGPFNTAQVTIERNSGDPVALCLRAGTLDASGPAFAVTLSLDRTPATPTVDAQWREDTT